ncbi:MAG: mannose-1-phosphate guanylyltransferase [Anaerolineae bacterium]
MNDRNVTANPSLDRVDDAPPAEIVDHLHAVIMAGGIGSRLWPRSRSASPKQFLDLVGSRTMLQETVDRITPLLPLDRVLVVVGEEHADTVRTQVAGLPEENIILEPGPRGTAPCIGLAATVLLGRDAEATMAVCPADHVISDAAGFRQAIAAAAQIAQDDYLVTLGIEPDNPNTGYGYIQRGAPLGEVLGTPAFQVRRFTEKPDASTAQRFVDSGEYYWNGGIFVWRADTILAAVQDLLPRLHAELQRVADAWHSPECMEVLDAAWDRVPKTTIDYGIMEKAERVAVVPVDIGWDDVGNWATLSAMMEGDEKGNIVRGGGHPLLLETAGTYLYATAGRLVAMVGLEGFVVVDTPDALLICPKDRAQDVRDVVEQLKEDGLQEYL